MRIDEGNRLDSAEDRTDRGMSLGRSNSRIIDVIHCLCRWMMTIDPAPSPFRVAQAVSSSVSSLATLTGKLRLGLVDAQTPFGLADGCDG